MSNKPCIFCEHHRNSTFADILLENDHAFVVPDNNPASPGHHLIIPKQHFEHWFLAPLEVQHAINDLMQQTYAILQKQYSPDGFNIGANCGKAAGQTVFHLHFHVIPRYLGDHPNPAGGVRLVLKH